MPGCGGDEVTQTDLKALIAAAEGWGMGEPVACPGAGRQECVHCARSKVHPRNEFCQFGCQLEGKTRTAGGFMRPRKHRCQLVVP